MKSKCIIDFDGLQCLVQKIYQKNQQVASESDFLTNLRNLKILHFRSLAPNTDHLAKVLKCSHIVLTPNYVPKPQKSHTMNPRKFYAASIMQIL